MGVTGEPCEACWAPESVTLRPWVGLVHQEQRRMMTASTWLVTRIARVEVTGGWPVPGLCASNVQIAEHWYVEDRQKEKRGAQDRC